MKKALIILLILPALCILYGNRDNKDYTPWWIYNHGDYAKTARKDDPRVNRAFEVFEQVKNAADKTADRTPRLYIIKTRLGPYALSLPDGGIIINPKTLDICYNNEDRTKGDSRLAFILGHELAHLANKDFIHRQAFLTLKEYGDKKAKKELTEYFQLSDPEKAREFKKRELLADQKGSLYAVMAGYDVGELFREKNNFLTHWANQTGVGMSYDDDPRHPSLGKRLKFVRVQQNQVIDQLELFRAGVLLFQMENYRDAAATFHEFSKIYPAREVFNNIGACYFNLAQRLLHLRFSEDYYRFRLSTTIAYETTAVKMQPRGEGDYLKDKEISRYIDKAEEYFRLAAGRDRHDRDCRCNLAAALILNKKYAEALAACTDILEKHPNDIKALNNKAIAFYFYGKEEDLETTQKAMNLLQKAYQDNPGNHEILYNLAALKQERERLAGAKVYWEKYLKLPTIPVDNFYKYVYKKLRKKTFQAPKKESHLPAIPAGVRLGDDSSRIGKKWGKKNARAYKLGNEENNDSESWFLDLQVLVKDNMRLVVLDGMIELIEKELPGNKSVKEMLQEFGPPQKIVKHTGGNFYVYKDKGFSIKEIKNKVCSYIWFEKGF
jgi:tetratricopeptide (TPR) repeat protein